MRPPNFRQAAPAKIAVLSDIHGNLPALAAVAAEIDAWSPELTIVNGDVVNRGPLSRECWRFVQARCQSHGWFLIEGNHEAYVAMWQDDRCPREGPAFEINRASYWTHQQLGREVAGLMGLPDRLELRGADGRQVRLTHGSMRGNRDGIQPDTPDAQLREQIAPAPDVFCTAHTHRPFVRKLDDALVVNSGAAGTTFDGDVRASYARLVHRPDGWQAEIVRVPYDREAAARHFTTSGFYPEGGPLVRIFYHEWYYARPIIRDWASRYEAAVLAGELDLATTVDDFLVGVGGVGIDVRARR